MADEANPLQSILALGPIAITAEQVAKLQLLSDCWLPRTRR
jgi:hypothetical protein